MSGLELAVIPEPREVTLDEGRLSLDGGLRVYATPTAAPAADRLARALGLPGVGTLADDVHVVVVAREAPEGRQEPSSVDSPEGYDLDVSADGVRIRGADPAGAFYGCQTLLQMAEDSRDLPLCRIRDWPDLSVRGVHFDLKGGMPTFEYLTSAIERLAHFKINVVLMEYEDRLAFPGHPGLAAPSALSMEQAAELERVARANHVQIVPLLQCLGHAEYILRRSAYAHLRESDDHFQQMCPSKPEVMAFFKERAEHLMALHPDSLYFHAGGDETRQLGECPTCTAKADRVGPHRLYFDYVKACCEYLIDQGCRPIIWDDILTRHAHALFADLPESTVVMYWLYGITAPTQTHCWYGGGCAASEQWQHKPYGPHPPLPRAASPTFEGMSPEEYAFFEQYADSDTFPAELSSTVFLRFMQESGVSVMGGSAIQPSDHGVVADPERGIPNVRTWARAIHGAGELGVVSTAWTRSGSNTPLNGIMEGMWVPFIASAEWYWSVEGVDERRFDEKVNRRLFGLDGLQATDAIWLIRHRGLAPAPLGEMFASLAERAARNRDLLRYYGVMAEVLRFNDLLRSGFDRLHTSHYASRHQALSERDRRRARADLAARRGMLATLRADVAETYAKVLHPHDVEDCLASMFEWPAEVLGYQDQSLNDCPGAH